MPKVTAIVQKSEIQKVYPKGKKLWRFIDNLPQLKILEIAGFERGEQKGKTMDVSITELWNSLDKQWRDLIDTKTAILNGFKPLDSIKQPIADLRNVAGCLYLKVLEKEESKRGS